MAEKEYDDEMKGVFFKQDETDKASPKSPDWSGKIKIEGTEYRIAGWEKESKAGQKLISIAIKLPQ